MTSDLDPDDAGVALRRARKARNLSQQELAARLSLPQSVVSDWETGRLQSWRDHEANLCDLLGLPPHYFSQPSMESPRRAAFRAWLAQQSLKVAEVAERSGVPATTLYSFASGQSQSLKGTTEAQVASAFGTTVDAVFGPGSAPAHIADPCRTSGAIAIAEVNELLSAWAKIALNERQRALAVLKAFAS